MTDVGKVGLLTYLLTYDKDDVPPAPCEAPPGFRFAESAPGVALKPLMGVQGDWKQSIDEAKARGELTRLRHAIEADEAAAAETRVAVASLGTMPSKP